jgi:hypothetical protein
MSSSGHDALCRVVDDPDGISTAGACDECGLIMRVRTAQHTETQTLPLLFLRAWMSSSGNEVADRISRGSLTASDAACSDPLLLEIKEALAFELQRGRDDASEAIRDEIRATVNKGYPVDTILRLLERLPIIAARGMTSA